MLREIIILLAVCVFANTLPYQGRIVNGTLAEVNQFPWMVGIFHTHNGKSTFCGGSLLNEEWILTAGHCVNEASGFAIVLGTPLTTGFYPTAQFRGVSKAFTHPDYQHYFLHNDVALIQLSAPVEFNDAIKPIKLPAEGETVEPGTSVTAAGWGFLSDESTMVQESLYYVDLTTISNEECVPSFNAATIHNYTLCAIGIGSKSVCKGDSGGPLWKTDADGNAIQVAVSSFVSPSGCAAGYPSGFTRVEPFLDFIKTNTGI